MEEEKNCPYSLEFQYSLLKLFLEDEVVFSKVAKFIKTDNPFDSEILWFFYILIYEHYEKYGELPDSSVVTNEIKKLDGNYNKYLKVYEKIQEANLDNREYILDQLEPFIKAFYFINTQEDLPEIYNNKPENAYEQVRNLIQNIDSVNFEEDDIFHLEDIWTALEEQGSETGNRIRTGIDAFDNVMAGGAGAGEVFTFLARDGVGKSMCLMNIGALALEDGKKVLHVHCEGKKVQPLLRYTARLAAIEYNKIRRNELSEDEIINIKDKVERLNEQLIIKPFLSISKSTGGTTIEDLMAYCTELHKTFKFDVVIVDYGDKLDTRQKTEANRFVSEIVWKGLEKIGSEFDVPVYTATQSVRVKGAGTKPLTKEDVAESIFKSRLSSFVVSINRNPTDIATNTVRFLLAKNREDETNIFVTCLSDYAKCRTHLPDNQSSRNLVDKDDDDFDTVPTADEVL